MFAHIACDIRYMLNIIRVLWSGGVYELSVQIHRDWNAATNHLRTEAETEAARLA
jgi:hypothetical protein